MTSLPFYIRPDVSSTPDAPTGGNPTAPAQDGATSAQSPTPMFDDLPTVSPADTAAPAPATPTPEAAAALARFHSCRWRAHGDEGPGDHCTHRDVLPFAGTTGFNAEAWCPSCEFYKLRRSPRKRENVTY